MTWFFGWILEENNVKAERNDDVNLSKMVVRIEMEF